MAKINLNLKENKNIVIIVVVIAVTMFLSKKIWDKQQLKLNTIKNNINTQQKKIELAEEIKRISKEAEKFKSSSWSTSESVNIMGKINDLANKYEVEISTFDPAGRKDTPNYLIFSMNLNIDADYFNLIRFLSAIEKLEHLTKITTLSISPVPDSGSEDTGPFARAYVSLDAYILKE